MNHAIVLAGGVGSRTGQDVPKQFLCVDNKPIIMYTLESIQNSEDIDTIIISCVEGWEPVVEAYALQFSITKLARVVTGGANRQKSIYNAFQVIKEVASKGDTVTVFDANRPTVDGQIIKAGIEKCKKNGAACGVTPCFDSMFAIDVSGELLSEEQDRDVLVHGTGPEIVEFDQFDRLLEKYKNGEESLVPSQMCIREGLPVAQFHTSSKYIKITTKEDIEIFKALLHSDKYSWLK